MANSQGIDFMFEIAFTKKLPLFYDYAYHTLNESVFLNSKSTEDPQLSDKIYMVYDIPSYLEVKKRGFVSLLGFKTVIQHKGYCIDLNGYNNLESYLKDRFSSNSRQRLRRRKKRLETSFDISYKMYHGSIGKVLYNELFRQFYEMLKLRAQEKGIVNRNLKYWEFYTKSVYDMILNKKASLFVIYDRNVAINISLNFHVKDTVFLFISTYNIDYSKFRVGHTNWMVQLDWFIKNNIKIIDFSKGNIAYKKRWTNKEYNFEYHLFYNKSKLVVQMKALWLLKKLQLKQSLRNKNINTYYYNTLGWLKGKNKFPKKINYQLVGQKLLPEKNTLIPISFRENGDYYFLRRIIYNYLYLTSTHVEEVNIYKELRSNDVFYIKNKKEVLKLILER